VISHVVSFIFAAVAEKGEISVGRQFRGRPEEQNERGTASVQTFGRPVFGQQKPEQRDDRVSAINGLWEANYMCIYIYICITTKCFTDRLPSVS